MVLPWALRRRLLVKVFGFDIHPTARIGKSVLLPRKLRMAEHSRIGSLTFGHGMEEIRLDAHAILGSMNWISGFPLGGARYFRDFPDRHPMLHLEEHATIVNRNLIDCTDRVTVGRFALVAGNRNQILTHGIDMRTSNQSSAPVRIGAYSMVGTGSILLKGSALPDYCALGAGSTLHKNHSQTHMLYSGVPAEPVRALDPGLSFFSRTQGTSD
ncbi:acyltransferase [Altererythrobacter sp. CC-YST694]|nr:acyltransferase [Altererythrobacter sp. CC-YST694]